MDGWKASHSSRKQQCIAIFRLYVTTPRLASNNPSDYMPSFDNLPDEILQRICAHLLLSNDPSSIARLARTSKKVAQHAQYRFISLSHAVDTTPTLVESLKDPDIALLVKHVRFEISDIPSLGAHNALDQLKLCSQVSALDLIVSRPAAEKPSVDEYGNAILTDEQQIWLSLKIPQLLSKLPFLRGLHRLKIHSMVELPVYEEYCQNAFSWLRHCVKLDELVIDNREAGGSCFEKPTQEMLIGPLNEIPPLAMLGFDHYIRLMTGMGLSVYYFRLLGLMTTIIQS